MKHCLRFLLIGLLGLLLTACSSNGLYHFTLVMEGEHEIKQDLEGELLVLGGKAIIPADVKLDGSAHVLSGSLIAAGEISGDVSFLNGNLSLEPTARIGGDLNIGGGSYYSSPYAVVDGRVNTGTGVPFPDLPDSVPPTSWTLLFRALISGSLLGTVAAILVRCTPNAVHRVSHAAIRHSLVSGAMGILVGIVGVSLLVTMAYTILLIPVTLIGLLVMGMGMLFGWIGIGVSIGRLGARLLKRSMSSSASAFVGTLAFILALELVTSMPVIGGLIGITVAVVGLGAVALTRFGLQSFIPVTDDPLTN